MKKGRKARVKQIPQLLLTTYCVKTIDQIILKYCALDYSEIPQKPVFFGLT